MQPRSAGECGTTRAVDPHGSSGEHGNRHRIGRIGKKRCGVRAPVPGQEGPHGERLGDSLRPRGARVHRPALSEGASPRRTTPACGDRPRRGGGTSASPLPGTPPESDASETPEQAKARGEATWAVSERAGAASGAGEAWAPGLMGRRVSGSIIVAGSTPARTWPSTFQAQLNAPVRPPLVAAQVARLLVVEPDDTEPRSGSAPGGPGRSAPARVLVVSRALSFATTSASPGPSPPAGTFWLPLRKTWSTPR